MKPQTSRRSLLLGAVLAPVAPMAGAPAEVMQSPATMTFEEARAAYPVSIDEARRIAFEFYRNDGPLRADDVTGTTAYADWEKANSVRFEA